MKTPFSKARTIMSQTLTQEQDLRDGYRANIAMALHDAVTTEPFNAGTDEQPNWISRPLNLYNVDQCNIMAERLLKLIFD